MRVRMGDLRALIDRLHEAAERKKIYVLVGPPSVGKSTWIANQLSPDAYIINRDDIVEQVASGLGWTYDDMYTSPPDDAQLEDVDEKYGTVVKSPGWMTWQPLSFDKVIEANNQVHSQFMSRVGGAVGSGQDIVVDMTNMNADSRAGALKAIEGAEEDYEKIAVDFKFQGAEDIIKQVAHNRAEAAKRMGKSKTIPDAAMDRMFAAYEPPSKSEGFDRIVDVDNIGVLKRLATAS